jgi:PAS domain-containing protein
MVVLELAVFAASAAALFMVSRKRKGGSLLAAFLDLLAMRKAAINAPRDGETRFRLLAEAIPQIVWTAVPGGGIDYCNQRFYDLTGFSKEETLGWAWQQALHPDDRPLALQPNGYIVRY